MATAEKQRSVFGEQLRPILTEKRLSVRKLGRMIDPDNPDRGRRNLVRWVSTGGKNHHKPTRASRDRVADVLGVDRSLFDNEDDEEEAELVRVLLNSLHLLLQRRATNRVIA